MIPSKVVELENLLLRALPTVVIRRGQSEQISQNAYRQELQRCRVIYDPVRNVTAASYKPEIGQSTIRDELHGFVCQELAEYIRDGRIQSASFAFAGGAVGGNPVEDVVQNLIRRTIVDGPEVASRAFSECATNSSCSFYRFFLLSGLRIDEVTEPFDGVTLIPLPNTVSELPPFLPLIFDMPDDHQRLSLQHLLDKTLLRVELEISPIFHQPEKDYSFDSGPERHFEIRMKGQGVQDLNLKIFCEALGLASRNSVRAAMSWASLLNYEIFDLSSIRAPGGSGWSAEEPILNLSESPRVDQARLDTIGTLYRALSDLAPETLDELRIPIDRWMKSMEQTNPVDQIIDLGIALESLYVPDAQGEVTLRFALHAAWHLGETQSERETLRDEFKEIYAARSDVMHAGKLKGRRARPSFDVAAFVSRAQDLCWQGITSVIEAGERPVWDDLLIGKNS